MESTLDLTTIETGLAKIYEANSYSVVDNSIIDENGNIVKSSRLIYFGNNPELTNAQIYWLANNDFFQSTLDSNIVNLGLSYLYPVGGWTIHSHINDLVFVDFGDNEDKTDIEIQQAYDDAIAEQTLDWTSVKDMRNALLFQSDWTQLQDVALSVEKVAEWATYRQALRYITETFATPSEVVFPTKPV